MRGSIPGRRAGRNIGLAEIAVIGQHDFSPAQLFRQGTRLGQHRLKLLLIVRSLRHIACDDQQAAFGDCVSACNKAPVSGVIGVQTGPH